MALATDPAPHGGTKRDRPVLMLFQVPPRPTLRHDAHLQQRSAAARPVIVVTGAHAEPARRELAGLDVREVWNPRWETGMGSSVGAGVGALVHCDADADAAVFMVCDQPHVTGEVIARLIQAHRSTGMPVVASAYGGSSGVPALFGRSLFHELAGLGGAAGAKQVIDGHASEAHFVRFSEGEVDVDTPDDYSRLI